MICKCSKKVSETKQHRRKERYWTRSKSITEVSERRNRQIHAELRSNGDNVDLVLRVVQLGLEQMAIDRVCRYAACAETVYDGPREAQPSHHVVLDPRPVAFHDALGHLLEEAAGVARVLALAVSVAVSVGGMEEGPSSVGWAVVELVDVVVAVSARGGG